MRVDPGPFDLAPAAGVDARGAAALCLHGFTGTPYEVRPLGEALAARGVRARGPTLPGHEGDGSGLAGVRFTEWLSAAREELAKLRDEHDRVYLVGLSMGGLLSLALASEWQPRALAVIGVPLRLRAPIPQLVPFVKYVLRSVDKKAGSDIRDPAARARHPSMRTTPLSGVHELVRLQRWVAPRLDSIRAPILVAHGRHDRTARPADAEELIAALASEEKELAWFEESGHVVTVDFDGEALARRVTEFLLAY